MTSATELTGGCACGALRYRLKSAPMFVNCCHCLNCQRQTGSAFVLNMIIEAARVEVLRGTPNPIEVPREHGPHRIFRCPECQIAVWSEYGSRSMPGNPARSSAGKLKYSTVSLPTVSVVSVAKLFSVVIGVVEN